MKTKRVNTSPVAVRGYVVMTLGSSIGCVDPHIVEPVHRIAVQNHLVEPI